MEKRLPIAHPMIESFSWQSTILAILQSDERCNDWIYCNYMQMYSLRRLFYNCNHFTAEISFFYNLAGSWSFYECKTNPWLDYFKIQRKIILEKWDSVVDFVIERIMDDEYVYIPIDRQYISAYQGRKNSHTMLIYGYNNEKREFYCADNFNRRYLFETVTFSELKEAFEQFDIGKLKPEITNNYSDIYDVCTFKKVEPVWNPTAYQFHLPKLINDIKEYLLVGEYGLGYRKIEQYVFGVECYDALATYVRDVFVNHEKHYDYRPFRAFLDHKIVMLHRIDFLVKNGYIVDGQVYISAFQEIVDGLNTLINKVVKLNIKRQSNETIMFDIDLVLKRLKTMEKETLTKMVKELEAYNDRK